MDVKNKVIELIKIKGPVIPVQISKEINSDILMTSAHLSELSSQGKVIISTLKRGGTPFYYLPGQESLLQNYSDNLHEKEKIAFELLKKEKILRDRIIDPVTRVALRSIKDFAIPLQVTYENNNEIFWKWYMVQKDEANSLIKSLLTSKEVRNDKLEQNKDQLETKQKALVENIGENTQKKEFKEKPKEIKKEEKELFLDQIKSHLAKNKVTIKSMDIIKKNKEIDFILEIPSSIGNLEYYCKTKDKKKLNEADLSSAFVQGQSKKLPILFLTRGEFTKRAKEMLKKEFKNININKI